MGFWGNAIAARQKLSLSLFFGTVVVLIEGVFFFLFAGYSSLSPYSMFNPQWFWSKDTYAPELTVNAFGECLEANRTTEKPFTGVRYHYDGNLRLDLWTHRPKGIEFFINGKRFGTSDFAELPNRMLVWNINKNPRPKTFMLDKAYPQTIRNLFGRGYVTYFHFGEGEAPHTFVSLTGLAYETTLAPKLVRNPYYQVNSLTKTTGVPYFAQPAEAIKLDPPKLTQWHYRPYAIVVEAKEHQLVKTVLTFYPNGVVASAVQDWADSKGWHKGQRLIFNSLGELFSDRPFNVNNYAPTDFVALDYLKSMAPHISEVRNPIVDHPRLGFFPSPEAYFLTNGSELSKLLAAYRVPETHLEVFFKDETKWYPVDEKLRASLMKSIDRSQLVGMPLIGVDGIDDYQAKSEAYYFYDPRSKRGIHFYFHHDDGMILVENGPYFLLMPKNHVDGTIVEDQMLLDEARQALRQRSDCKTIRESVLSVHQEFCDKMVQPIKSERFQQLIKDQKP